MLSERHDTITLWLFLLVILIAGISVSYNASSSPLPAQATEQVPMGEPSIYGLEAEDEKKDWVLVRHESGANYLVRPSAIIAITEPPKGSIINRNSVMLSNGTTLATTLDITEFVLLLNEEQQLQIRQIFGVDKPLDELTDNGKQ